MLSPNERLNEVRQKHVIFLDDRKSGLIAFMNALRVGWGTFFENYVSFSSSSPPSRHVQDLNRRLYRSMNIRDGDP